MGIEAATLLMVAGLFALMAIGVPLAASTLLVALTAALLKFGPPGLLLISTNVTGVLLDKHALIAVPFFVFMANVMERSGVARELFDSMSALAGRLRGGVAVQTCLVSVVLAAMSGIVGGEIVLLGLIALPQMLRLGYDRKLSIGGICASGSLATLIPPSVVLIVYGAEAGVSIKDLFSAGITPGILLAGLYIAYILARCNLNPALSPPPESGPAVPLRRRLRELKGLAAPGALIFGVLGSIYAGIATVTESAAIGAAGAMLVALLRRELSPNAIREALWATTMTTGAILWIIIGAVSLVGIYNIMGGGAFLRGLLTGADAHPMLVVLMMMGIVFLLGTFMEWIAIVFITVPVFAPVISQLGYDPVWFGILFAMNIQIYMLSPPFGPACFYLKSVAPADVSLREIYAAVLPFIFLQIVGLGLVMAFPQIALWLPRALG